ncbi:prepilin-type N-terminal cleavage/methylation domain-containing protein [Massilia sp. G4R7]|uniref:Prepilin-type N-terminal cleavage/methylation domain-containing protein n=1 Tax=Massilia phyllostachyos TaxID=2898585 RepID=A0ABS8QEW2_9BURK|nr:prepilin-type N-terminal cleavage/methylation domain-containing protein [Massilia phyllostachyos]MCD2519485.1 prepilin-type N-terminal cleavage/methylation domain-containing protein [Massilia phyllostachyos]
MRPMRPRLRPRAAGFTLLEAMVALAIFGILLAVGIPRMSDWLAATKANAAAGFYAEGFTLARAQALANNSASRLVLSRNDVSGQYDWRVDLCFPSQDTPCSDASGSWSDANSAVKAPLDTGAGFKSVVRSADALPGTNRLAVTPGPDGDTAVYFTPLGWVDTRASTRMMRIDLTPASNAGSSNGFRATSVVLTLAGVAARCEPNAVPNDSRRCPE